MKIKLKSYADAGNFDKERLVMTVVEDANLGNYAVLKSSIGKSGNATAGSKSAYWFPDRELKSGDMVVLYTKSGNSGQKELSGGRTAYFYYWKRAEASWGDGKNSIAVLLEAPSWASLKPDWDPL